jgi:membrane protein
VASAQPEIRTRAARARQSRSFFSILRDAIKAARSDNIGDAAAALAYYAFTSLPATLLTSLGLFALIAGQDAVDELSNKLAKVAPAEAVTLVRDSLDRTLENRSGAVVMIAVGAVLALWTATGAMNALMRGLNSVYDRPETRGFVAQRLTALAMVVCAFVALALMLGLLVLGPFLSEWVGRAVGMESVVSWLWWAAQWPLLIGGLLLAAGAVLYLGPNVEEGHRLRFLTLGSAVAVAVWLAASGLFAVYVSQFGSYNKTWGSLSAVIVTLVWLWLGGLSLLLGAEVDAVAEHDKEGAS